MNGTKDVVAKKTVCVEGATGQQNRIFRITVY
jgi:hypothetical protein